MKESLVLLVYALVIRCDTFVKPLLITDRVNRSVGSSVPRSDALPPSGRRQGGNGKYAASPGETLSFAFSLNDSTYLLLTTHDFFYLQFTRPHLLIKTTHPLRMVEVHQTPQHG
jgi:hypothetical protein